MTFRMKRTTLLFIAAVAAALCAGCSMSMPFSKKSDKPKDTGAIATQTDAELKQRWVERRTAELVAKGTDATAAKTQAEAEFNEKYSYTSSAKK